MKAAKARLDRLKRGGNVGSGCNVYIQRGEQFEQAGHLVTRQELDEIARLAKGPVIIIDF